MSDASPAVKPGIKTTEFWVTAVLALVGPIVTILVGTGQIKPEDAQAVTDTVTTNGQAIVDSVVVTIGNITSLLAVRKYIGDRSAVKVAASR